MKKILLILFAILFVTILTGLSFVVLYRPTSAKISLYDKNGIKFTYYDSWKTSDKSNNSVKTLNLQKSNGPTKITIEVRELPLSYKNYSFQQIVDAVKLKVETDNSDWENTFSGTPQTSNSNYTTQQLLYETNDKKDQAVMIVGESKAKLFIILMESSRNDFDLVLHDLDVITDSFEVK